MNPTQLDTSKALPYWAQLTSFVLATVGFTGTAYVALAEFLKTADLETKLTKDCFYRVVERGEAVFCRATVMARRGPVLIRTVAATLTKLDGAQKSYNLDVMQFGSLITKADKLIQEHNYYGRSVLHYLPEDKPERVVYFCLHRDEYKGQQMEAIEAFQSALNAARGIDLPQLGDHSSLNGEQKATIQALVTPHVEPIVRSLQIEPGQYQLDLCIEFESTSARFRRFRKMKKSKSSLSFTIPASFTRAIRISAEKTMKTIAGNELYGRTDQIIWPEFTPSNYVEH